MSLITTIKDEVTFLPLWLQHYDQFFSRDEIIIIDDRSQIPVKIEGVNVVRIEHRDVNSIDSLPSIVTQQASLCFSDGAQAMLFAEADEFLNVESGNLREFIEKWSQRETKPFHTAYNVEVVHDVLSEPDLVSGYVLEQRSKVFHIPKFSNPLLWKTTPRWARGYHDLPPDAKPFPDEPLLLDFHLHYVDYELMKRRHAERIVTDYYDSSIDRNVLIERLKNPENFWAKPVHIDVKNN